MTSFVLQYGIFDKKKRADSKIVSCHENNQKSYKKWLNDLKWNNLRKK